MWPTQGSNPSPFSGSLTLYPQSYIDKLKRLVMCIALSSECMWHIKKTASGNYFYQWRQKEKKKSKNVSYLTNSFQRSTWQHIAFTHIQFFQIWTILAKSIYTGVNNLKYKKQSNPVSWCPAMTCEMARGHLVGHVGFLWVLCFLATVWLQLHLDLSQRKRSLINSCNMYSRRKINEI